MPSRPDRLEPPALLAEALRGRRVLVVERDPAARDSVTAQLAALGLATDAAASGPEALLRVAREISARGALG